MSAEVYADAFAVLSAVAAPVLSSSTGLRRASVASPCWEFGVASSVTDSGSVLRSRVAYSVGTECVVSHSCRRRSLFSTVCRSSLLVYRSSLLVLPGERTVRSAPPCHRLSPLPCFPPSSVTSAVEEVASQSPHGSDSQRDTQQVPWLNGETGEVTPRFSAVLASVSSVLAVTTSLTTLSTSFSAASTSLTLVYNFSVSTLDFFLPFPFTASFYPFQPRK